MAASPDQATGVGSPRSAGRSARNYPHLVAGSLGLDLVDVTYSGATTAHVLTDSQRGVPPQIDALDGTETLVTVTIGGNDAGYVPMLFAAACPGCAGRFRCSAARLRDLVDPASATARWLTVGELALEVGRRCGGGHRRRTVLFVDYLTLLPPAGALRLRCARPTSTLGRRIAATLERLTADAAAATGCGLVRAARPAATHHAWSARPWTTRFGWPVPGQARAAASQRRGMRAVADLVVAAADA